MTPEQLKASILQYAMEGKLVKQNPDDEPASVLLEKIKVEKEKLIQEGKIKKAKKLPEITDEEKPFDIPDGWKWVRIKEIGYLQTGTTPSIGKNNYLGNYIPFIKPGDIYEDRINYKNQALSEKGLKNGRLIEKHSILTVCIGSIGKSYVTDRPVSCNQQINTITPLQHVYYKYILACINSRIVQQSLWKKASKTTLPIVNRTKLSSIVIPLPPLEEQKRIVAKIEKLMPLVDKYAEAYNRLQKIDGEFKDKLKQTILQYAMEGKLVKQNPNDEPASILFEKIKAEKEKLVKEGKSKKSKKLPAIEEDEKPFNIPDSWEWVRFGNIVNFNLGKTPSKTTDIYWHNGTVPWVTIKDMQDKTLSETDKQVSDRAIREVFNNNVCQPNTLLMSFKLTIGKTSILNIKAVHNEAIIDIIPLIDDNHIFRNYLFFILPYISQYASSNYAIKGKTLNKTSINNMLIPLPPLAEQKRIVAKIDRMMIQIDEIQ